MSLLNSICSFSGLNRNNNKNAKNINSNIFNNFNNQSTNKIAGSDYMMFESSGNGYRKTRDGVI
ncbi:hypothetical protein DDB_G0290589 [Dictyostelium discoideum AX4]|uniref:Putative uncharacterized protein DDB_G0290589 n=1 Tax=Dictyostelium discoideum TaxID=44689 RepID=Y8976_DICDI|nr:hypothetical protein DDB_G0290589 [Dictyostelium discoideum AX4]Q54FU2.1 RecName: Full=Putative uncharacterized protein DDB_G0290589 [Dictyostelium discoideum]EAL62155.1 hypothetical protein DDB_G0290589 [Dictyostelium discoideum AX4]|eukprot:XP_635675.1 hypothetical protein DDB_G0290589 [Dictyostelium discoideum AX4]